MPSSSDNGVRITLKIRSKAVKYVLVRVNPQNKVNVLLGYEVVYARR